MITASCPACGSPIAFASGAALTAVCPQCTSCVVREGDILRDWGRIARFQRDLSPIQLDATGNVGGRRFRVAGGIRKARDRVRWNEWYVVFDDGGDGWIGEGNGQWFVFPERVELRRLAPPTAAAGSEITLADRTFQVMENAEAAIVAAEGNLPYGLHPGEPRRYLDLRETAEGGGGARFATLDLDEDGPVLWLGRDVTLVQLQMEGLRAFAGWSDPVLVHFAGPQVEGVRTLQCPACGSPVSLHAPGQTPQVNCAWCGSSLAVDADGADTDLAVIQRLEKATWRPPLPLGKRGRLRGTDWAIIGAMTRYVQDEGGTWEWAELLLHNPYRGFAWLVQDTQRHWSFVEPLRGAVPALSRGGLAWKGARFRRFQTGTARVRHVVGEFTWEVAAGDTADTADWVAPPTMLSREQADGETTWSVGTWLPHTEVEKAFGQAVPSPDGVAPHQPNPAKDPAAVRRAWLRGGVLVAWAVAVFLLAVILPDRATVYDRRFEVVNGENVWVTEPFVIPGSGTETVAVKLGAKLPSQPDLLVSFIEADSGAVWDWTTYGDAVATARLPAGTWTARVASAVPLSGADLAETVHLEVVHDPGAMTLPTLLLLYALAAPLLWFVDVNQFEQRRWANASP